MVRPMLHDRCLPCLSVTLHSSLPTSLPHPPFSLSRSLLLTALGVLRMLPVLQRFGDAYGF